MRPFSRRVIASSQAIISEGPLIHRAPIGRHFPKEPTTSRWLSTGSKQKQCSKRKTIIAESCHGGGRTDAERRQIGGVRSSSTSSGGPATSVRRSNTGPLLGLLFGASAVTYIGSALISDESRVDIRDDSVKSDNRESITETEGTYSSFH